MPTTSLEYIAAGGNRHPSAADWKPTLLAFGSGNNIALWNPEDIDSKGITALLKGHTDVVNAVKIFNGQHRRFIISGGADKTIRIWRANSRDASYDEIHCLGEHQSPVNVISNLSSHELFASGSADGTVKIWHFSGGIAKLVQSISLKPRFLPLACTLAPLGDGDIVLAVAGTSASIQLYVRTNHSMNFELQATLTGHESWIRSLDFVTDTANTGDVLLASASQDKYIRLWRLHRSMNPVAEATNSFSNAAVAPIKKSLSNKSQQVGSTTHPYDVTFEALLIGHEDWIYSARWAPHTSQQASPRLLSASADNSLAIWMADEVSGIWVCQTRLGEISAQKGSTTATGSTGGFYTGLWRPDGNGLVSLGRTGSWRRWNYDLLSDSWLQQVAISGHTQEVRSCAWSPDGSYLLSTGSDQTTRLFAEWKRNGTRSWHEFARPQIHGYDLNCLDYLSTHRFISGADEKLLRVFNMPRITAKLLSTLCGANCGTVNGEVSDAANIPVLGLSNKAVSATPGDEKNSGEPLKGVDGQEEADQSPALSNTMLDLDHPPFEEHLARHTLWPEREKLYGHGYEISAVAASHDGSLVATACKASSLDHAVIRLYDCKEWRETKPSLTAHSLTVTSLKFSPNDQYLLSVGRDRNLTVFERHQTKQTTYSPMWSNPKAHSRMILDCAWALSTERLMFASAGRDKLVKIWELVDGSASCVRSISVNAAATAVAFGIPPILDTLRLSYGTEDGKVSIVSLLGKDFEDCTVVNVEEMFLPSQSVSALRWRPKPACKEEQNGTNATPTSQLAVVSDDYSIRIINVAT